MAVRRKRRRTRCRFCRELFTPDPRLKGNQYACSAAECQHERKQANQRRWLARQPGYFTGRYPNTKDWLRSHPGYVVGYRRDHPDQVERDNGAFLHAGQISMHGNC